MLTHEDENEANVNQIVGTQIFSLKENWDSLMPFLDEEDVVRILNESMQDFCQQHPMAGKWVAGKGPWWYTPSDLWMVKIDERVEDDKDFKQAKTIMYYNVFGGAADINDNELWDELLCENKAYSELHETFVKKHSPKDKSFEYYQVFHGCHWIVPFITVLLSKALTTEEICMFKNEIHSVTYFVMNGIEYYADILNEWRDVNELEEFMGDEYDYFSATELIDFND
jgi:hypothetical protein